MWLTPGYQLSTHALRVAGLQGLQVQEEVPRAWARWAKRRASPVWQSLQLTGGIATLGRIGVGWLVAILNPLAGSLPTATASSRFLLPDLRFGDYQPKMTSGSARDRRRHRFLHAAGSPHRQAGHYRPPSPASSSSRLRVHGYGGGGAACDRRASGVEHGLFGWGELDRRVDRAVPPHRRVMAPGRVDANAPARRPPAAMSCRPNIIVYFAYGSPSVCRPSALS